MPQPSPSANLLPPIDIPLLQPPILDDVEGADGGIGLRHIEHPLLVHMARPENTPPGTVFELYWGDPQWPVAGNFIREDDEDLTRIPFIVPVDHILEAWADPVYAKVIHSSGNSDETERLRLRVNLQRPGGRDPDDETPGHQRLVYELPPDVLIDGIDDTRAAQGVEIVFRHWENMAPYDLLILVWGSERIEHRVQPDEVNTDIRLTVDYATIGAAGNGEAIPVGFQVEGATGNYPDEWARWSPITWVDVYLDTERPDAPWLTFPETERDIELEQLGGQGVRVGARVSSADARAYSVVTLVWAGTDNEGVAVPHLESQTLSGGKAYYFTIEHALVTALAKGTAYVYYLLQGEGLPDKRSYNRHLRILGDVVRWPAPRIDQLIGDYLEPDLPEATVRFPAQASWPDGARLEVVLVAEGTGGPIERWIGARVGDIPITPEGEMLVAVPASILKHFDGYPAEVYYVLSRQDALPQESLRLKVHVGEPVRELPEPIVEQAPDGVLNPDDITEYAWVIAPFTGTLQGDWITLHWIGPAARTSVRVQVGVDGATTEHDILIDYITPNLDEQVRIFYTLERSQQRPRYSHIAAVEIRRSLGDLPQPAVLEADPYALALNLIKPINGATVVVPHYTGMRLNDEITVYWVSPAGTVPVNKTVSVLGVQNIHIARASVVSSAGRTVNIYYRVKPKLASEPSPPSDVMKLDIHNPELVGVSALVVGPGFYPCSAPTSNVDVPQNTPIGTVVMQTHSVLYRVAGVGEYRLEAGNFGYINNMGQQPACDAVEFATNVPGIAARFLYTSSPSAIARKLNGDVSEPRTGTFKFYLTSAQIEFVKMGEVITGSIEPGDLLLWVTGSDGKLTMSFRLLHRVTFTALP